MCCSLVVCNQWKSIYRIRGLCHLLSLEGVCSANYEKYRFTADMNSAHLALDSRKVRITTQDSLVFDPWPLCAGCGFRGGS